MATRAPHRFVLTAASLALLLALGTTGAAELYVYPAGGQAPEQQRQDQGECQQWATTQSGFDPLQPPPQADVVQPRRGGVLRGALAGAAVGEIVDDDAGKGAAVGGVVGGMRQSSRNAQAQQHASARYQDEMARYEAGRDNHLRAYAACLEARGYTVK